MNMPSSYQLKPCPFCGGKAQLEGSFRAFVNGETTRVALVKCTACQARSGRVPLSDYGKSSHSVEANQKAIDMWNRRVEDERPEA